MKCNNRWLNYEKEMNIMAWREKGLFQHFKTMSMFSAINKFKKLNISLLWKIHVTFY